MSPIVAERLLDEILAPFPEIEGTAAFALLDAARDERIYPAVMRADAPWSCLYRGDAAATMAEVAPYLVQLDRNSRFPHWVLAQGGGNSWGVFLNTVVTLETLRAHFRRLILVQLPDGRAVYFRFYDPRVLRVYLPTCTPDEAASIFGPVDRFVMENERSDAIAFTFAGRKLAMEPIEASR